RRQRSRTIRLPLLRRRAARVDCTSARARRPSRARVRVLQQQLLEPRWTRRPRGPGRRKREGVAAAARSRARSGLLMDVLAIVHGPNVGAGVFGDAVRARGDRLVEWFPTFEDDIPRADAALVFGGAMHVDQEAEHPWLRIEVEALRSFLDA